MATKIQTNKKNNFGQTVLFIDGIKIKFDHEGKASVENKKIADKLIENSDFLFYEGKIPQEKPQEIILPQADKKDGVIQDLSNKLHIADQRVDSLKADKNLLEGNLKDWKAEVERLTIENESLKKIVGPDLPKDITKEETLEENIDVDNQNNGGGENTDLNEDNENLSLEERKEILAKLLVPELKEMCKEANLDRGEWETLKKEDLITYLIENLKKE